MPAKFWPIKEDANGNLDADGLEDSRQPAETFEWGDDGEREGGSFGSWVPSKSYPHHVHVGIKIFDNPGPGNAGFVGFCPGVSDARTRQWKNVEAEWMALSQYAERDSQAKVPRPRKVGVVAKGAGENDRCFFAIAMDEVTGKRSLGRAVGEFGKGFGWTVQFGLRLCDALKSLHGAGLVHRDLSRNNVMISLMPGDLGERAADDGDRVPSAVSFIDLGLSRTIGAGVSDEAWLIRAGTPFFSAPEMFFPDQNTVEQRSMPAVDVYSIGALCFYARTGKVIRPEAGLGLIEFQQRLQDSLPLKLLENLPEPEPGDELLARIIDSCTKREPRERPTVDEVHEKLEHAYHLTTDTQMIGPPFVTHEAGVEEDALHEDILVLPPSRPSDLSEGEVKGFLERAASLNEDQRARLGTEEARYLRDCESRLAELDGRRAACKEEWQLFKECSAELGSLANGLSAITLDDEPRVAHARDQFDKLSPRLRAYVEKSGEGTLAACEAKIAKLKGAKACENAIRGLPSRIGLSDKGAVKTARTGFESLEAEAQKYVPGDALRRLELCEHTLLALECQHEIEALPLRPVLKDLERVAATRQHYESLPPRAKELIKAATIKRLEACEQEFSRIEETNKLIAICEAKIMRISWPPTLENEAEIEEARRAWRMLPVEAQANINAVAAERLKGCETEMSRLRDLARRASRWEHDAISLPEEVAKSDLETIECLRREYDALDVEGRHMISHSAVEHFTLCKKNKAQLEAELKQADSLIDDVSSLPSDAGLSEKSRVTNLRSRYENLSREAQRKIEASGAINRLSTIEQTIAKQQQVKTAVEQCEKAIESLPLVPAASDGNAIRAARTLFESLENEGPSVVAPSAVARLVACERAYEGIGQHQKPAREAGGHSQGTTKKLNSIYATRYKAWHMLDKSPVDPDSIVDFVIISTSESNECPTLPGIKLEKVGEVSDMQGKGWGFVDGNHSKSDCPWQDVSYVHITDEIEPLSCKGWFMLCDKLKSIDGLDKVNMSSTEDATGMFYGCKQLKSLTFSQSKTQKLVRAAVMFKGCESLRETHFGGLSFSSVEALNGLFYGCKVLPRLDTGFLSGAKPRTTTAMFYGCSTITNLDLSEVILSSVEDANAMFFGCSSLCEIKADRSNWLSKGAVKELTFFDCKAKVTFEGNPKRH